MPPPSLAVDVAQPCTASPALRALFHAAFIGVPCSVRNVLLGGSRLGQGLRLTMSSVNNRPDLPRRERRRPHPAFVYVLAAGLLSVAVTTAFGFGPFADRAAETNQSATTPTPTPAPDEAVISGDPSSGDTSSGESNTDTPAVDADGSVSSDGPGLAGTKTRVENIDCSAAATVSVTVIGDETYTPEPVNEVKVETPLRVVVDADEPLYLRLPGSQLSEPVFVPSGLSSVCVLYAKPGRYEIRLDELVPGFIDVRNN